MTSRGVGFLFAFGVVIKLALVALTVYVVWYLLRDPATVGAWFGHIVSGFNAAK